MRKSINLDFIPNGSLFTIKMAVKYRGKNYVEW